MGPLSPSFRLLGQVSILLLLWVPPALASVVVHPRDAIEVSRFTVRLSDVFEGIDPTLDQDIAQAPAPCHRVTYDTAVLDRLTKKFHLDWHPTNLTDQVVVTSTCHHVSTDTLRAAIIDHLKDEGLRGDLDISFDNHTLEIDLPASQNQFVSFSNFIYDSSTKRFHAEIMSQNINGPYAIQLSGHVILKRRVPVIAHRLEAKTVLSASDLEWASLPEETVNRNIISEEDQLVGHEIRRDMDRGEVLHSGDISVPKLVARGSMVTIKIETPFMIVTTQGKALQDGIKGDVVHVLNIQSNRVLDTTVEDQGVVSVQTAQKVAVNE